MDTVICIPIVIMVVVFVYFTIISGSSKSYKILLKIKEPDWAAESEKLLKAVKSFTPNKNVILDDQFLKQRYFSGDTFLATTFLSLLIFAVLGVTNIVPWGTTTQYYYYSTWEPSVWLIILWVSISLLIGIASGWAYAKYKAPYVELYGCDVTYGKNTVYVEIYCNDEVDYNETLNRLTEYEVQI